MFSWVDIHCITQFQKPPHNICVHLFPHLCALKLNKLIFSHEVVRLGKDEDEGITDISRTLITVVILSVLYNRK